MPRACRSVLAGALALALTAAPGARWGQFALDPATYTSPSGEYALRVDPSDRSGAGEASYRFTKKGAELWSGKRPWTLWKAEVADDGRVAGYAYEAGGAGAGLRAYAESPEGTELDALTIVLLAADGSALLEERSPRTGFSSDLGCPEPMVLGLFFQPDDDRLVVRVGTGGWARDESWWTYSLASGRPIGRIDPRASLPADQHIERIADARALPGLPLTLAEWSWSDFPTRTLGAVFTLADPAGAIQWRLDWNDDHSSVWKDNALWDDLRRNSEILALEDPGRFTLRQVSTNERVTFEAMRVNGAREGWDVREVGRAPYVREKGGDRAGDALPAKATDPAHGTASEVAELALRHLGTISLGADATLAGPIHDVMDLALDGRGRPGIVRRTDERLDFVRVDASGENAVEIALPPPVPGHWPEYGLCWVSGERWVVTRSELGEGAKTDGLWIDASARSLTPIEGFESVEVKALCPTGDGGFLVLGGGSATLFDATGKRRRALDGLSGPDFAACTSDGRIVVLYNGRNRLQLFTAAGDLQAELSLEKAWGREPSYPTRVHADLQGGWLVEDFEGDPPIVRMDREGTVVGAFEPRFADGGRFTIRFGVQAATDGTLWTSDGQALLVLGADGVVARVVGPAPDASALGAIGALALGPADRLYAVDGRTGAVHVFGADGKRERVCRPEPSDFRRELMLPCLTIDDAGEVFVSSGDQEDRSFLRFAADGTRIGKELLPLDRISQEWYAQHGSDRRWVVGYEALFLVAADGSVVRKIEHARDGRWLRGLDRAAVAPDGSLALETGSMQAGVTEIHLFDARGEALRSFAAPAGLASWAGFAFDGERLALGIETPEGTRGSIVLLDAEGRTQSRFTPPGNVSFWQPFFAAGGHELWLFDLERRIERFELR